MKKVILTLILGLSIISFTEPLRKISVTGNAEKEVMPDIAKISFRAYTKNEDIQKAGKENETNFENFKKELERRKIPFSNIETYNYYTQRTVEQDDKKEERTEYVTTLYFSININDFKKVPELIGLAEENKIKSIKSNSENKSFYYFGISKNSLDKDSSITDSFRAYDDIKKQIQNLGINEKDISIYSYLTETKKVQTETLKKEKEYYNIYNDFNVEIQNLKNLNDVIEIAEKNKINLQGNIIFDISNKEMIESELYKTAYEQTKVKAASILKSSEMKLGDPLVVSESVSYQQVAIYDDFNLADSGIYDSYSSTSQVRYSERERKAKKVDYKPEILKLTQNVSVLFEIK